MKANKKILPGRIKYILLCTGLAVFFVSIAIPAGVTHAQGRVKGEWVLPKHYPDGFDGYGRIYTITADKVVIDDSVLKLSASVEYSTPTNRYAQVPTSVLVTSLDLSQIQNMRSYRCG